MQNSSSLLDIYPAGMLISIEIDLESDVIGVILRGELDMCTGRRVLSVLEPFTRKCQPSLRIDLTQVSFIDSAGASAIVELADSIAREDGYLEIDRCSDQVEYIFAMLGIPVPGVLRD